MIILLKKKEWWIYLHDSSYSVDPSSWNSVLLAPGNYYSISFSYKSFHLLKSPFATNCADYKSDKQFVSRKDCLRNCKLERSIKKCGVIPHYIEVYRGEASKNFAMNDQDRTCLASLDLGTTCLRKCPHVDCVKTYYKTSTSSAISLQNNSEVIDKQIIQVEFVLPIEPETTFIHRPRIETVEFICYLASTVSLWFGVSMFSTLSLFDALFIKAKNFNFIETTYKIRTKKVILRAY